MAIITPMTTPDVEVPDIHVRVGAAVHTGALDVEGTATDADASTALTAALADLARDIDEYCAEMRRDIDTLLEAVKS